jgi:TolB protein
MPDADDDRRIADAFAAFRANVTPCIRPAGADAVRDTVRHRRRVAAVAAVVACAVALPAIAYAAIGDPQQVTPPPGATSAPPTPEPSPSASPSPSLDPPPPPSSPSVGLPPVPGTVFYLDHLSGSLYADGRRYPGGDGSSVNVSPDGTRVTWVDMDPNGPDTLLMSDLDGGNRRTLHYNVDGDCVEPVWSGDSTRLLFARTPQRPDVRQVGILYLAGGAGDHLGESQGCHYRWSADGRRIAYLYGGPTGVKVSDLDGGRTRTLDPDVLGGGRVFTDLAAISANGGRVCVSTVARGEPQGDVARDLNCDTVIDVANGEVVDLPIEGELRAALFTPDGGLLARVDTGSGSELVLLDADDRVVARSVESPANADRRLLSYTPNQK